jgi:hypothetical protein
MIDRSKDLTGRDALARRSVVYGDPTALPGGEQPDRILEDFPSRATALLCLAAGQSLAADPLRSGLELLVVEGEIAFDGVLLGQYGYARRLHGPSPVVAAAANSLLLVKRGHIPADDRAEIVIEPRPSLWQVEADSGLPTLLLHRHAGITIALRRYQAGTAPVVNRPPGGEEILVLDGTLLDERSAYPRGSWIRNPPGSLNQPYSLEGCLVYAQSGHLPVL